MKTKVTYSKEFLNVLRTLSVINKSIEITNTEDKVQLSFKNPDKSVAVLVEAPIDNFNFKCDKIDFDDYVEFFNVLESFKDPSIEKDDSSLYISAVNQKMKYRLTDPECIDSNLKSHVKDILIQNKNTSECTYLITAEEFKDLVKMISLVDGELVEFKVTGSKIDIKVSSTKSSHVYEETFEGTVSKEFDSFELPIEAKILKLLPCSNYKISMNSNGFLCFELVRNDDISVGLYIAESKASKR